MHTGYGQDDFPKVRNMNSTLQSPLKILPPASYLRKCQPKIPKESLNP